MRKLISLAIFLLIATWTRSQTVSDLQGVYTTKKADSLIIWIFVDGYSSQTTYKQQAYVSTFGGPYTYRNGSLHIQLEYNDMEPKSVNETKSFKLNTDKDGFLEASGQRWEKAPTKKQSIDGLWRITGREQGGRLADIPRGDRKTIKLLADGYFQWIAINPANKGFYGTGGGHYTFAHGKYAEHILFFSRDNTRVGADLFFEGEVKDGVWHHRGLSSKGEPIHEIWSRDHK